jgi:dihydroxy-acid dehydratase
VQLAHHFLHGVGGEQVALLDEVEDLILLPGLGPEAAVGGEIALLKDGDIITIDADKGTMDANVSPEEFAKRKAEWKPRATDYTSGYIWKYAQQVGDARKGAVTHPGGAAEKECYADI